jgi:hypothetical protein
MFGRKAGCLSFPDATHPKRVGQRYKGKMYVWRTFLGRSGVLHFGPTPLLVGVPFAMWWLLVNWGSPAMDYMVIFLVKTYPSRIGSLVRIITYISLGVRKRTAASRSRASASSQRSCHSRDTTRHVMRRRPICNLYVSPCLHNLTFSIGWMNNLSICFRMATFMCISRGL